MMGNTKKDAARDSARLWVVPRNDGEALEIVRLLVANREAVLVSRQSWGASWVALEPELSRIVSQWRRSNPRGVVIGIELAGKPPKRAGNIDHHWYPGDDRRHPASSLEQVASLLGVKLNRWQKLVALNDRGYIPALQEAGATEHEIAAIRDHDRCAQGLTADDRTSAERDIRSAQWSTDRRRVRVRCRLVS